MRYIFTESTSGSDGVYRVASGLFGFQMRLVGLSSVPILRGSWVVTSGDYKSPGMVCNFGCSTANPT